MTRRTGPFVACVFPILVCVLNGASAQTMEDFVAQAEAHANWADRTVRQRIEEFAPASIRRLLRETRFVVDVDTPIPNAYAITNRRVGLKIVMSAQFVLAQYYNAELFLLNMAAGNRWERCALSYQSYVRVAYSKMMEDIGAGRRPLLLLPPETYARRYGGDCKGLDASYPLDENLKDRRYNSVSAAIITVYLHELAHIRYGDRNRLTTRLDFSNPRHVEYYLRHMCYSQQAELRADEWAVRTLIDLGWGHAVFDTTLWSTFGSFGTIDPDMEVTSTHPSSSRRMAVAMQTGRQYLRARGQPIVPELSKLIDDMIRLQAKIERLLPVTRIPGMPKEACH